MTETTYTVTGMTCEHCVASVREELGELSGVLDVSVELDTGRVKVTSEGPLTTESVRSAVTEAGYALAGDDT